MNVEIETEAAQFPEKEYINGIFIAVQDIQRTNQCSYITPSINAKILRKESTLYSVADV